MGGYGVAGVRSKGSPLLAHLCLLTPVTTAAAACLDTPMHHLRENHQAFHEYGSRETCGRRHDRRTDGVVNLSGTSHIPVHATIVGFCERRNRASRPDTHERWVSVATAGSAAVAVRWLFMFCTECYMYLAAANVSTPNKELTDHGGNQSRERRRALARNPPSESQLQRTDLGSR